ncbi:MAG TPA: hypothetical protein VGE12_02975 [Noviherbaspirillum sp.]
MMLISPINAAGALSIFYSLPSEYKKCPVGPAVLRRISGIAREEAPPTDAVFGRMLASGQGRRASRCPCFVALILTCCLLRADQGSPYGMARSTLMDSGDANKISKFSDEVVIYINHA